ncbi:MAG: phosphoribosylaminoimidazolesuccinocarboxamide synthase [Oscillospiraceae bacterium]|nr:phosphoribosylaminoimidazolesuccinocarboxamide synthase [Ruminococcus sp.]MCD7847686.1 phosphoribosylaminoimidazolesuccinocarboxamide synthase [Oscillospiraceae bacterium]MCD8344736.1 phosphoribosylaminoimidazolesuccinocarboxamide synthase [Oscillospiraceae bacterium]
MDKLYEGKSKIVYEGTEPGTCIIKYKDTATAGNGVKKEDLPGKGILNAKISNLIFEYLAKNGVKTHLIKVLNETEVLVKKADIVMVEVIVRNVAAGSFSKKYGVPEGTKLLNTVTEFSLKSDELGDPMINDCQITALGVATQAELDELKAVSLKVDELMTELFLKCGIKLIDFKLEFGRVDGELLLCDEISPDSCRLWDAETDEKLDKDRFRRDLGNVLDGYRDVLARLENAI